MTTPNSAEPSANRVLRLRGGRNFRDLGGYVTEEGRRVRWQRLYRSGVMSYLTAADHAHLTTLGIRAVCDFRTPHERTRERTCWSTPPRDCLAWDYDAREVSLRGYLRPTEPLTVEIARSCMIRLYQKLPTAMQPLYAGMFDKLAAGAVPLVFHCSAGKDRTGLAAALLLTSLGVPRDQVFADFVLTNDVVDLEKELFAHPRGSVGIGEDHSQLLSVGREARAPLLQALPEYLDAAFDAIKRDHGSIATYVRTHLGVTEHALKNIRDNLLED